MHHGPLSPPNWKHALASAPLGPAVKATHARGIIRFLHLCKTARAQRRIPTVLSPGECRSLFAQVNGTIRLMAELAYGAGLRLLKLLRLRVHHLDLPRRCLQVFGGKGDEDRVTLLPESLVEPLRAQVSRLRTQWELDRPLPGLPGVWLPEGLARKYPKAGVSWEWPWLFPARKLSKDPRGKPRGFDQDMSDGFCGRGCPHPAKHGLRTLKPAG